MKNIEYDLFLISDMTQTILNIFDNFLFVARILILKEMVRKPNSFNKIFPNILFLNIYLLPNS